MGQQTQRKDDLLVSANFIRAVRESGYVSLDHDRPPRTRWSPGDSG
jgi:hypothetical protein